MITIYSAVSYIISKENCLKFNERYQIRHKFEFLKLQYPHKININFNRNIETKYQQKKRVLKITSERTLQGNLRKKQE